MNGSKTVKRLGIDLGKNNFHPWGVNEQEQAALRKKLKRTQLLRELAKRPPCPVGMEACGLVNREGGFYTLCPPSLQSVGLRRAWTKRAKPAEATLE